MKSTMQKIVELTEIRDGRKLDKILVRLVERELREDGILIVDLSQYAQRPYAVVRVAECSGKPATARAVAKSIAQQLAKETGAELSL